MSSAKITQRSAILLRRLRLAPAACIVLRFPFHLRQIVIRPSRQSSCRHERRPRSSRQRGRLFSSLKTWHICAKVIPPAECSRRYGFKIRAYEVRSSCAEIGVLHHIVAAQIFRRIAQHDLAGFEYIAAIRYLERLIGVLLDDKYSNTVLV